MPTGRHHRIPPRSSRSRQPVIQTNNAYEKTDVIVPGGDRRREHGGTADDADSGRRSGTHGHAGERHDLLHPPQRKAQGAGRLLHPARRGRHPGGRQPAGTGPLPGAHGLQRHEEPAGQDAHRIPGDRRREVRLQPQRIDRLGPDDLPDQGRADGPRRGDRLGAADPARLVALHRPGGRRDRRRARSDLRGAAHARRCFVALDDGPDQGSGQRLEV